MISRELLGRAHGALGVATSGGPCVGVLREILGCIEGEVPDIQSAAVSLVSNLGDPTLMFVSATVATNLGQVGVEQLRELPEVQLRFMRALLTYALRNVDRAIGPED